MPAKEIQFSLPLENLLAIWKRVGESYSLRYFLLYFLFGYDRIFFNWLKFQIKFQTAIRNVRITTNQYRIDYSKTGQL